MKLGGQRYKSFFHLDGAREEDITRNPVSREIYVFMISHILYRSIMLVNECDVGSFGKKKIEFGLGDF